MGNSNQKGETVSLEQFAETLYSGMPKAEGNPPAPRTPEGQLGAKLYDHPDSRSERELRGGPGESRDATDEGDTRAAEWEQQVRQDREIGGAALEQSLDLASEVTKEFGTPAFRDALEETGFGSHPELIRLLARVGRALKARR